MGILGLAALASSKVEAPPHVEARRLQTEAQRVEWAEGAEGARGVGMATALATAIAHSLAPPHHAIDPTAREGTEAPLGSAHLEKDVVLYSGVIVTFGVVVTSVVVDVSANLEVATIRPALLPQILPAAIVGACFLPTLCPPTNCSASHLVNDN